MLIDYQAVVKLWYQYFTYKQQQVNDLVVPIHPSGDKRQYVNYIPGHDNTPHELCMLCWNLDALDLTNHTHRKWWCWLHCTCQLSYMHTDEIGLTNEMRLTSELTPTVYKTWGSLCYVFTVCFLFSSVVISENWRENTKTVDSN